jgi:hypothetical protein
MMKRSFIVFFALIGFVVYPTEASLFEQTPPDNSLNGIFSYHEPLGGIADNFMLSVDSWVTDATWYGYYADADLAGEVTSVDFVVRFYSDSANLPDSILYEDTLTASVADSGQVVAVTGGSPFDGRTIYKFTASLDSPLLVTAGDNTWLSVVEDSTGDPRWLWDRYDNNSLSVAYWNSTLGNWALTNGNMAFSLDGTVVPVPGAILLGILGLSAVGIKLRKFA